MVPFVIDDIRVAIEIPSRCNGSNVTGSSLFWKGTTVWGGQGGGGGGWGLGTYPAKNGCTLKGGGTNLKRGRGAAADEESLVRASKSYPPNQVKTVRRCQGTKANPPDSLLARTIKNLSERQPGCPPQFGAFTPARAADGGA